MIDLGEELVDLRHVCESGDSPLVEACEYHHVHIFELFLTRGAEPLVGTEGGTFLNTAMKLLGGSKTYFGNEILVPLMKAIAKAQAAKGKNKLALRQELYALNVLDDDRHTPLSRAMTLCICHQREFRAAPVECGFDKDFFALAKKCPIANGSGSCLCSYFHDLFDHEDSPLDESQPTVDD